MSKNLFDDIFSVFDKVTEVFNEEVNKIKENGYYKSETWENGECVDKVEKEWKDGKLVKDEEFNTRPTLTEIRSCNCTKDECKCNNTNEDKVYEVDFDDKETKCECSKEKTLNDFTIEVLNDEINKLNKHIDDLQKENDVLKERNKILVKKNQELNNLYLDFKQKLNEIY